MSKANRACIFFLYLVTLPDWLFAQADSCKIRISLLTCSPGEELYSTFGHSALRLTDPDAGTDIVYNYGTFDFDDPAFYSKFVRGKLLYYLNQEDFRSFLHAYQSDNRSVSEQVLNLSCREKVALRQALFVNLQPDNRYYKYDFLFDNCTTRLRDLILRQQGIPYQTSDILDHKPTAFRELLHYYLNKNHMPWSRLGIDILLGKKLDRDMSTWEAMFLPDYLEKGYDSSHSSGKPLVSEKIIIFRRTENNEQQSSIPSSPMVVLSLFAIIAGVTGQMNKAWARTASRVTDFLLFFLAGLVGCLLIFMWLGTDHVVCRNNFNLLWAFPAHIVAAFFIRSKKPAARKYFYFSAILSAVLLLCWFFLPQQLNTSLIPFVLITGWRSHTLSKT
jgi:hypothetical protein